MTRLVLLLSFCAAVAACAATPRPTAIHQDPDPDRFERLITLWDARDGAALVEVGSSLSEAFAAEPNGFFVAMAAHPSSFDSWLAALPRSTFTAYTPERLPAITALLPAMRSAAEAFRNHPRHGGMAARLADQLSSITIREID